MAENDSKPADSTDPRPERGRTVDEITVPGFGQYPGEASRNEEGPQEARVLEEAPQVPRAQDEAPGRGQAEGEPRGARGKAKSDRSE